jgi:hypothetical protein
MTDASDAKQEHVECQADSNQKNGLLNMSGSIEAFIDIDQVRAKKLLILWALRAHKAASAHYEQSSKYGQANTLWTCVNAVFSIVLLFLVTWLSVSSIGLEALQMGIEFVLSLFGAFLVTLGIVQFILRYSEKQDSHRQAGQEFSNLQRKIERYSVVKEYNMVQIHNLSRDYNHITKSYPLVGQSTWTSKRLAKLVAQIQNLENELRDKPAVVEPADFRKDWRFWRNR